MSNPQARHAAINRCCDAPRRPRDIAYARPSSNHARGAVAAFCDGHLRFLSEEIDYAIYQHLMTPDSRGAGLVPDAPAVP
jgi:prepilin-type processing-associated H-X9-DG protein